jgi:hypothetical protein
MHKYLTLLLVVFFINHGKAQDSGGISIQTGLSYGFSKEKALTRSGEGHYGWGVGLDARLFGGDMYFLVGGQYHRTSLFSTSDPNFFKTDMDIAMMRMGMGFTIVKLGFRSYLRTKLLASINFVLDGPDPKPAFPNATAPANLNDSYLGGTTGIGWTKGIFDIDLEFQYGLLNSVFKQPETNFNYFTLMVGVNF